MTTTRSPGDTREAYYDRIGERSLAPLWTRMADLITPEPRSDCRAHHWDYARTRSCLLEAGKLISAEEAERRVLILENPGLAGSSRVTTSLYAGIQLVLPGEIAPAHRHSQSALRFVLEGTGAHSVVDGERTVMAPGDLLITPPMSWHDHGNDGEEPAIWLDGLDIPMMRFFDASFFEPSPVPTREVSRPAADSWTRYGSNLRPLGAAPRSGGTPIVNYPYARSREVLDRLSRTDVPDLWHGHALVYVNPVDGGEVLPTMSAFLQLLPSGTVTRRYRSTDARVLVPVEGNGRTTIGDTTFSWGPNDVLVVPSWSWVSHEVDSVAVLFGYSDRAAQRALGLWREEPEGEFR